MATENKKYLDLSGLQHLLNKLNDANRIVVHPTGKTKAEGAYKIAVDANGHVTTANALTASDIGAATPSDIGNGKLTLKIGNKTVEFTANQATNDNETFEITTSDLSGLGLEGAMHFKGVVASLPTATTSDSYANGDVILVGNKEYVRSGKSSTAAGSWVELGDEGSHALKSITINGDGTYITGGGSLESNRTLSHKLYNNTKAIGAYKVAIDSAGHVSSASALSIKSVDNHTHTASVTIPGSSFGTSITPATTKLSVSSSGGATETVVTSYPGTFSKLNTTTVTGVGSTTTTASKATAGTAKDVAKAGTAVTVATKASTATTVGNANKATTATDVLTGVSVTNDKTAYHAAYDSTNECLELSAVTLTVTPTTKGIYEAVASETTIYGCGTNTTVTPAVSNGTITPYTFENVTVPIKATTATTVATGDISATGAGASLMTGLGTATTASVIKTEKTYSIASGTTGVEVMNGATLNKGTDSTATVTVNGAGGHTHDFN